MSWRACVYGLLATLPIAFVAMEVATWVRNIPNWDEFDTVLDFLLALDSGARGQEIAGRLLAVQNEHRMLASRLLFATSYWISGGINFIALAVIGNLFLLGIFARFVGGRSETAPRLRLAAIFSLTVFQLQHHESLFWAGASIDHFFVILAVVVALGALTSASRWSLAVGCTAAFLATFSLAHGLLVWPIGMVLLWSGGRRRECLLWLAAAAASAALFFLDFQINPGHRTPGLAELPAIVGYWLTLAGSSPALGNVPLAPWLGALLVAATAALLALRRGEQARERLARATLVWCLGAMAMIAWGRALLANDYTPITSRYVIQSSIAWALLAWLLVERALAQRTREPWWFGAVLAGLVGFNLAANAAHHGAGRAFAQDAEKAVRAYHRDGTFGRAETPLYPDPARADAVIREVEERNIFRLPEPDSLQLCDLREVALDNPHEIADAAYFLDDVEPGPGEVHVRGWAFRPDHTSRLGEIAVVFRSADAIFAFEATSQLRPDVAEAHERRDAIYAGFQLHLPHEKLPAGEYGVGICFTSGRVTEYIMTARVVVIGRSAGQ